MQNEIKNHFFHKVGRKLTYLLRRQKWNSASPEEVFTEIYRRNHWNNPETVSGPGSAVENSKQLLFFFPRILNNFSISSINDAACGDFNWLKEIDLGSVKYNGYDIVNELIDSNNKQYGSNNIHFHQANLVEAPIQPADLVICRDMLVHLPLQQAKKALNNMLNSSSQYLLATTFPFEKNTEVIMGMWRPLNLCSKPFNLPQPLLLINENPFLNEASWPQRFIGLWKLNKTE